MSRANYYKDYWAKPDNRKRLRKATREYHRRLRQAALALLGNKCVKCNYADHRALNFDHIADDGAEHRKAIKTNTMPPWIVAHPEEAIQRLQILCANCNGIKEYERRVSGE